jgi:hypothetical protein
VSVSAGSRSARQSSLRIHQVRDHATQGTIKVDLSIGETGSPKNRRRDRESETYATQDRVVEPLDLSTILTPPSTNGGSVMGRGRADGEVGVLPGQTELLLRVGRHALNAKTKDSEIRHDGLHALGDHTKILAADEHTGSVLDDGQTRGANTSPELLLTSAVEVAAPSMPQSLEYNEA